MPPVESLVLITALACVLVVSRVLYQYMRYFRWRTSDAGPFVVMVLWLLLARHLITVIYQLDMRREFVGAELLVAPWNLAALSLELWLSRTLRMWRKRDELADTGERRH